MSEVVEAQKSLSGYTPTLLDCFCGMGGVSDGFAMEGFDVTGIDIVDAPKLLGYKHRFIQANMMTLDGKDFRGYDVIWGSPPCRDFTAFARCYGKRWKRPPNPKEGLILIDCFREFVERTQPKFWVMENVYGLVKYLKMKPQVIKYLGGKKHAFWGNSPPNLMPAISRKSLTEHDKNIPHDRRYPIVHDNKLSKWERAKIPLPCSRAFAQACKQKLLEMQP